MAELRTLTAEDREELQAALELVQSTQTDFWMALGDLEGLLDYKIDLDGNTDFEDYDVETLLQMEHNEENNDELENE